MAFNNMDKRWTLRNFTWHQNPQFLRASLRWLMFVATGCSSSSNPFGGWLPGGKMKVMRSNKQPKQEAIPPHNFRVSSMLLCSIALRSRMLTAEMDESLLLKWPFVPIFSSLSAIGLTSAEWRGSRKPKRRHVKPSKIISVPTLNDHAKHRRWTCQHSTSFLSCPVLAARIEW